MKALCALCLCCFALISQGQWDSLLQVLQDKPEDSIRMDVLDQLGQQALHTRPDTTIVFAEEGAQLAARSGSIRQQARFENMIGIAHTLKGQRREALPRFLKALSLYERMNMPDAVANVRSNVARLHLDEGHLEMAEAEYRTAIKEFNALGNTAWEAGMMQGLADVYRNKGMRDSARVLFGRAADVLSGIDQALHAALARNNEALYTDAPGEEALALERHREARALLGDGGGSTARVAILGGLAKSLVHNGLDDEAAPLAHEVLRLAQAAGLAKGRHDMHQLLAGIMERRGRDDSALWHLNRYVALHDSLVNEERSRTIVEMQERYDSERKDAELAHNRVLLERRERSIRMLAAGAVALSILLIVLWRLLVTRRRMSDALRAGNTRLEAALTEREMLLREIHHRVKNNLQMVGGLLRMQGRHINDPAAREAVRDSQDRVRSMALIHQDLYLEDDPRGIDMAPYVEKLAHGLLKSHGMAPERIDLHLDVTEIRLDVDTAIPIGLILNELIVNALKHAFPDGRSGNLNVALREEDGILLLVVADDGVGHDPDAQKRSSAPGFGLGMLHTFAEKLQAHYAMNGHPGTEVRMHIRNFKKTA